MENFKGPLDLLLFLIQKEELDITDVELSLLTTQFAEKIDEAEIDLGSEWLVLTATLLLIKSQKLIPGEEIPEEELPRVAVFQKLLEYCQIKEAASALANQEDKQRLFFSRGGSEKPERTTSGLEEVAIEDLTALLRDLLARAPKMGTIEKEQWEVSPKIEWLRSQINLNRLAFTSLFHSEMCRGELIVTFLALLELMKLGEVRVIKEEEIYVESTGC